MTSMCQPKCLAPYGVHVSPKMCGPLCIHLRNPLQNQWQKWCKINEHLRGWVPLEPCWLKMTPPWSHVGARWPRGSIFHWFLEQFWDTKITQKSMKKWSDFQTPSKTVFSAQEGPKGSKMESKSAETFHFWASGALLGADFGASSSQNGSETSFWILFA